jgi:hypothetical protein
MLLFTLEQGRDVDYVGSCQEQEVADGRNSRQGGIPREDIEKRMSDLLAEGVAKILNREE